MKLGTTSLWQGYAAEDRAVAAGWFKLRRGWYHINAWEPHGPYEPRCYQTAEELCEKEGLMNFYTVVLDAFDGQQYGLLRIAVQAATEDAAHREAIRQATEDGYTKIKIMMTLT